MIRQAVKKHMRIPAALALAGIICLLCASRLFYALDNQVTDRLYQEDGRAASTDIVVIGIDEKTIKRLGLPPQWSREILARVIRHLNSDPENRPAVIGVDMLLTNPSISFPEGDELLAEACAEYGNVVLAESAIYGTEIVREADSLALIQCVTGIEKPFDLLCRSAKVAHVNAAVDADRILRHGRLWVQTPDGETEDSLAWALYQAYCEYHGILPNSPPPVSSTGLFYIRFSGPHHAYEDSWTFLQCLDEEIHSRRMKGKIVLIGGYAPALGDSVYTSLTPSQTMYGVEAQANIIDSFMNGDGYREVRGSVQLLIMFLFSFAAALLLWNRRTLPALLIWLLGSAAWVGGCFLARRQGLVVHVLWGPVGLTVEFAMMILMNYTNTFLAKQKISRTFGRYVDPSVLKELMANDTASALGGEQCQIAVLFVDIRGFTSMSETLPPQTVVEILNRYLSLTTECVMRNHGTLDKFVGDCTMAIWGAPVPSEDPVGLACQAALEMQAEGKVLGAEIEERCGRKISFGIGIHYGPAVVGNIGAPMRMDYTAIGDTVNTAARLEANAPGEKILVSGSVKSQLGSRARFSVPDMDIHLKGKQDKIDIYFLDGMETGN